MGYRVVVAGATGNVGREMLAILAEREFPIDELAVLASARSTGDMVDFGETGKQYKIQNIEHFDPTGWDMALFAIGSEATKVHAPRFAAAGCTTLATPHGRRHDWKTRLAVGTGVCLCLAGAMGCGTPLPVAGVTSLATGRRVRQPMAPSPRSKPQRSTQDASPSLLLILPSP